MKFWTIIYEKPVQYITMLSKKNNIHKIAHFRASKAMNVDFGDLRLPGWSVKMSKHNVWLTQGLYEWKEYDAWEYRPLSLILLTLIPNISFSSIKSIFSVSVLHGQTKMSKKWNSLSLSSFGHLNRSSYSLTTNFRHRKYVVTSPT